MSRRDTTIMLAWFLLSLFWAAVMLVTNQIVWPSFGWVATTLMPLSMIARMDVRRGDS